MSKLLEKYLAGVKKIIPEKQVGSAVGIDIGQESCKTIEITKAGQSYQLVELSVEPTQDKDLKGILQSALSKVKTPTKSPFTSISGKGTLIRYISMPKMSIDDLKKSLAVEADKYFPFAKDQIYTDCYILDSKGPDNKMSVLVAAAKKELVDERLAVMTEMGLQSEFIGINSIAMANVVNTLGVEEETEKESTDGETGSSAIAILDMGASVSNLLIMLGPSPRFTRDIHLGGQDVSKRISNALGISFEEAEKIKHDPKDKLQDVLTASDAALINLTSEIRLSFDYFTTEYNFQISKLLLTGGASLLEGSIELFGKNLGIPVERWNPLKLLKLPEGMDMKNLEEGACRSATALGLALYHYQ